MPPTRACCWWGCIATGRRRGSGPPGRSWFPYHRALSCSYRKPLSNPDRTGMRSEVEAKRRYLIRPGVQSPDWLALVPGVEASIRREHLTVTYLDTDDLRLVRAGASLRHCAVNDATAWRLT